MVSKFTSPTKEKTKSGKKKYKKDALEFVDYEFEFKNDPKFKTELCKTFSDTGFCAYGNKCRFAHGRDELFDRMSGHPKYRKSDCLTFHSEGFCNYGPRCHFRHYQLYPLKKMDRTYFYWKVHLMPTLNKTCQKRLPIFESLCKKLNANSDGKFLLTCNSHLQKFQFPEKFKNSLDVTRFSISQLEMSKLNIYSQSAYLPRTTIFSEKKTSDSVSSKSPISSIEFSPEDAILSSKNVIRKLNFNDLNTDFTL
jgi:hypothetical protein